MFQFRGENFSDTKIYGFPVVSFLLGVVYACNGVQFVYIKSLQCYAIAAMPHCFAFWYFLNSRFHVLVPRGEKIENKTVYFSRCIPKSE